MIPVNEPDLNGNEKKYLSECIDSGWISSEGPFVKKFEDLFAKKVNRLHGVSCSSGTAALDIAFEALNIGPMDEVIMPAFTIISCVGHLIRSGAKPILVDSNPNTWNMNPEEIEKKITTKTKLISITHLSNVTGAILPIKEITELAHSKGIIVVVDGCQGAPHLELSLIHI